MALMLSGLSCLMQARGGRWRRERVVAVAFEAAVALAFETAVAFDIAVEIPLSAPCRQRPERGAFNGELNGNRNDSGHVKSKGNCRCAQP